VLEFKMNKEAELFSVGRWLLARVLILVLAGAFAGLGVIGLLASLRRFNS
jgi:hypothetical protein